MTQKCPHCAETIIISAKICKHCKQQCLFELVLHQALDEKQNYVLAKHLIEKPTPEFKASSLKETRLKLKRFPQIIASNLTKEEVQTRLLDLSGIPLEVRPKSSEEIALEKASLPVQIFYGLFALCFISLAVYFLPDGASDTEPQTLSVLIPEIPHASQGSTSSSQTYQQIPSDERLELSREDMEHLLNATVFIRGPQSLGSGFLISSDGYILSNSHVTSQMDQPLVSLRNGQQFRAQKIRENTQLDISLLKINSTGLPFLKMGDANTLYPGQSILTIGNPSGLSFTVTRGIVSYVGREIQGVQFIQTDAAINPGNSGGPMITYDLKVVGINTLTSRTEKGISFALPINYAYSPGGLAEGIGDYPPQALGFNMQNSAPTQRASLPNSPSMELPVDIYQKEAESYRYNLEKEEQELLGQADQLKTKIAALKKDLQASASDLSQKNRIQSQIDELTKQYNRLPNQLSEARIRYYKRIISLLHRQKGDSRFSHLSREIETQIEKMQEEKKKLEESPTP